MTTVPDPQTMNRILYRLCGFGVGIGLLIIVFQLKFSGLFSTPSIFAPTPRILLFLIFGILLAVFSFFCTMRCRYGRWCLVDPGVSSDLKGNAPPELRAIITVWIGFNMLMILAVILSISWLINGGDRLTPYVLLGFFAVINLLLMTTYRLFRAREKGEPVPLTDYKKILLPAIVLGCLALLLALKIYSDRHPQTASDVLMLVYDSVTRNHQDFTLRADRVMSQTGWMVFDLVSLAVIGIVFVRLYGRVFDLTGFVRTLRTKFSGPLKMGLGFNALILVAFLLIKMQPLPDDLRPLYGFVLPMIFGAGNMILLGWAVLKLYGSLAEDPVHE